MRLLHRERAERYNSARDVILALDAVEPFTECPSCGERMPEHFIYCGRCGARLEEQKEDPTFHPTSSRTAENLCDEGFQLSRQRKLDAAVQKYSEALAIDPNHLRTIWNLGFALNRLGRYNNALKILTSGLQLDKPDHRASMFYERSLAQTNLKRYMEALDDIKWALERQPESVKFLYLRARIHLYLNEMAMAKTLAKDVLRLEPDHSGALRLWRLRDKE